MGSLSILEALDNLNVLIDVDSMDQIEVTEDAQLIAHFEKKEGDYWVHAGSDEMTRDAIRETFKSVHEYLVHFYDQMRKQEGDPKHLIEGINSVMVLVGEAANKLEKQGSIFKKHVIEIPEYQALQDFYKNRVIQELFAEFAKVPVVKPVEQEEVEEIAGVHILNDIEVIKRDHLYELFSLKNEAGQDFYTIHLARNLKLACDFGEYQERYAGEDPFVQVKSWEDRSLHLFSKRILNSARRELKTFYKSASHYRDMEIVKLVHCSVMALMLAANPRNLLRQFAYKGCYLYFADFQMFLRNVLHTQEYERLLVYEPEHSFLQEMMALIETLIAKFFLLGETSDEAAACLRKIMGKTKRQGGMAESLHAGWTALEKRFAQHPNGPVFKALDSVRELGPKLFDPLMQGNVPNVECSLSNGTDLLRMPAPIRQHFIHRAEIAAEFTAYLRLSQESHLLINYQDRTSWREHARSVVLEELGRHTLSADQLTIVTLAKDTEFYDQCGIYETLNKSQDFLEQFVHHLNDEKTGYYFPKKIKDDILPLWASAMLNQVHTTFFKKRAELSQQERLDFISISYLMIELKLIELLKPSRLIHCSKDGLDVSGTSTASLLALLQAEKQWSEKDQERFFALLFVPTMMQRERTPHPERMERLESLLRRLEESGSYLTEFAPLFTQETLNISVLDS